MEGVADSVGLLEPGLRPFKGVTGKMAWVEEWHRARLGIGAEVVFHAEVNDRSCRDRKSEGAQLVSEGGRLKEVTLLTGRDMNELVGIVGKTISANGRLFSW